MRFEIRNTSDAKSQDDFFLSISRFTHFFCPFLYNSSVFSFHFSTLLSTAITTIVMTNAYETEKRAHLQITNE